MKKFIQHFLMAILATFTLVSCSSTQQVSDSDPADNSRRYYKEYIGNRIVYHDKVEQPATEEPETVDGDADLLNTEEVALTIMSSMREATAAHEVGEEKFENEAADITEAKKDKRWKLDNDILTTLKENHENVVSGAVFTKKFYKERKTNSRSAMGGSEVFALLALIFGAASVSAMGAAAIGISFGVVAIVFALIGQDAEGFWRIFSLAGLILGIIGAALSFIFIFV